MNITESETPYEITAKTCGSKENGRKVIYSFVESFHNLSKDKKDIMISEIHACDRLKKYARDDLDREVIESEITDLKMALDLMTQIQSIVKIEITMLKAVPRYSLQYRLKINSLLKIQTL